MEDVNRPSEQIAALHRSWVVVLGNVPRVYLVAGAGPGKCRCFEIRLGSWSANHDMFDPPKCTGSMDPQEIHAILDSPLKIQGRRLHH